MPTMGRTVRLFAVLVAVVALAGCPARDKKPESDKSQKKAVATKQPDSTKERAPQTSMDGKDAAKSSTKAGGKQPKKSATSETPEKEADASDRAEEKPRDLGLPLVDDARALRRLHPEQPVWLDPTNRHVVLLGEACRAGYPLEFFATYSNRSYEAVVAVNVTPEIIHAGLLMTGAEPGHPAQFKPQKGSDEPEVIPPTGTEIAIEVRWKDEKGKVQSSPAQEWVRDRQTKKALNTNWVFAGSVFVTDEETGKKYYRANSGETICVLSLPGAMLDLPISNSKSMDSRTFEAFAEHMPPPETPVTLILKPILSTEPAEKATSPTNAKQAAAEKAAVEVAGPWLALVDQGEYAKSWETASDYLKDTVERKELVRLLGAVRKPLGAVKSRELQSKKYLQHMPSAPDGQYVRLEYKTSFENKAEAIETVTPMLDKDKKWRVSGYYIK
jgi:hypothetical protein